MGAAGSGLRNSTAIGCSSSSANSSSAARSEGPAPWLVGRCGGAGETGATTAGGAPPIVEPGRPDPSLGARQEGALGGGGGRPSTVGGRTSPPKEPGRPTGEAAGRPSPLSRLGVGDVHGPGGPLVGGCGSVVSRSCSRPGVPEAGWREEESEVDGPSTSAACARNRSKIARPRSAEPSEGGGVVTAPWWPPNRPGSSTTKSHRSGLRRFTGERAGTSRPRVSRGTASPSRHDRPASRLSRAPVSCRPWKPSVLQRTIGLRCARPDVRRRDQDPVTGTCDAGAPVRAAGPWT